MAQNKSGPPPIVFILLALILGGGGFWYFTQKPGATPGPTGTTPSPSATTNSTLTAPDSLPAGATVQVDGSTSMVVFNKAMGAAFKSKYPGSQFSWKANGSSKGIQALLSGQVDVAASSRALKPEEISQGLIAVPVKTDGIAVLVGSGNPFNGGLTTDQLRSIYAGQVNNWSQVGGSALPLRVINRNPSSGTYSLFKDSLLAGAEFGNGPNWVTMSKDVTTELLQKLGTNGIGYANYSQIKTQRTVRPIAIDGQLPDSPNYPFVSVLYYVYGPNASEAAKAFVALAAGPTGQAIAATE